VSFAALAAALVRSRREVAVRRRTELELLRKAALTDSLTGLGNHRASQEDLRRALESHRRSGQPLTVMRVDLRGLKQVNDTLGHQAGDARLCALADRLRETGRQIDTAYRTGGDEFTIILPGTRAWDAFQLAQRLRTNALAGDPPISFSCGITEFIGLEDVPTLVRRADLALIDAKRSKRAAVIYADGLDSGPVERDESHELEHYKLFATALARAVDTKDSGTRNHCETVAEICVLIARELGLSPSHSEKLRMAGLLHDVGKIGIADTILGKPDELNEVERATMRTHVTLGHNIVSAAGLEEAAEWILHHHERLDGQGYPNGLGGDHIPFASKIIHVADSFEAITADRPYRKGRSPREALVELERHAGTQFDPACVEALSKVLAANDELESPEEATDDQEHRDEFSGMAAARDLLYDHYPANRAASA
jgi:diguanylate cyclase (GGDEF)-like protein/putative nucleotidyltransferase with HDIG domain